MNSLIEKNRQGITQLGKKRGVCNVRLFGSMSRQDATESSDVDFLVELKKGYSGFALGGFLKDVSDLLGRRVDVVTENALHPTIREQVLKESIPL